MYLRSMLALLIVLGGCASSDSLGYDGGGGTDSDLLGAPGPDGGGEGAADLRAGSDIKPTRPAGESCAADGECFSGLCKPVDIGQGGVCVLGCKAQADCLSQPGTFCAPGRVGSEDGYCMPASPYHCASCTQDADCGVLTERCLLVPGDAAPACHVDCALAGPNACPPDYDCASVADGMKMRKLCVPKTKICLDALGGFCDRVALPQACVRNNTAGTCVGQRSCVGGKRYGRCDAMAPQYKRNCTDQDPAGCMLYFAPGAGNDKNNCGLCGTKCAASEDCCAGNCKKLDTLADCGSCGTACGMGQGCCTAKCTDLNTVQNCGACGNACPGVGVATSEVSCAVPAMKKCDMTCRGENYDVDAKMDNGCEQQHPVPPGHTEATASSRGHNSCRDGSSTDTFDARLMSDSRGHMDPGVDAFSGTVGSAPDFWTIHADGGPCVNDYEVTFTTAGGGATACYQCTIITNKKMQSETVSGAGTATMSSGMGSYNDGTTIYFKIEKTCSLPIQENVSYTVHYHL